MLMYKENLAQLQHVAGTQCIEVPSTSDGVLATHLYLQMPSSSEAEWPLVTETKARSER